MSTVHVFDIDNMERLPSVPLESIEKKYMAWRSEGYGVLMDRSGDVCLSMEDPEDDGLSYQEQIKELENLKT